MKAHSAQLGQTVLAKTPLGEVTPKPNGTVGATTPGEIASARSHGETAAAAETSRKMETAGTGRGIVAVIVAVIVVVVVVVVVGMELPGEWNSQGSGTPRGGELPGE